MNLFTPNWKMTTLNSFIESLTQEHDKFIQMGIIRSSRDQALVAREPKVANDKGKQKDESPVEKQQSNGPSGSKRSKKNGKGKTLCSYCGRGFHLERSCMRRKIDEMDLLLKKHNIIVPASTRKAYQKEETKEYEETCNALKASYSIAHCSSLIIELPIIWSS